MQNSIYKNFELILKDIETISNRIDKIKREVKAGKKIKENEILNFLLEHLNNGKKLNEVEIDESLLKGFNLLTNKPVLFAINVDENQISHNNSDLYKNLNIFLNNKIIYT